MLSEEEKRERRRRAARRRRRHRPEQQEAKPWSLNDHLASGFLSEIVSESRPEELTRFERLFVAENAGLETHPAWHADLYVACGCLQEAMVCYRKQQTERLR